MAKGRRGCERRLPMASNGEDLALGCLLGIWSRMNKALGLYGLEYEGECMNGHF